jgi:hypothetical protein
MSESGEGVDFTKREPAKADAPASEQDQDFDPYRFGAPEHPIPAEFAPPGYKGPTIPSSPYGSYPGGASPGGGFPGGGYPGGAYPGPGANPFSNPPGTPYTSDPPSYPPQYGYPAPPPYHSYPAPATGNGKAIAGLVLGILSIVLSVFLFLDGILVILGLVFSIMALNEAKSRGGNGRGMAIAGLVCTIVGALLATMLTVLAFHAIRECGGIGTDPQSDTFKSCFQDHITDW